MAIRSPHDASMEIFCPWQGENGTARTDFFFRLKKKCSALLSIRYFPYATSHTLLSIRYFDSTTGMVRNFAHEGKRTTVRARPRRKISLTPPLSSKGHRTAGRHSTRQGESKIVHFRQLFRKALGTLFSPDIEGQKRDLARSSGQEPQGGSSHFSLYL